MDSDEMAGYTKSGRVLTDADLARLADEAERGYDISDQEPTLPEVWVAELLAAEPGSARVRRVKGRLLLTSRSDASDALAANWRIVRYVRADVEATLTLTRTHVQTALERAQEALDAIEAGAPRWQATEPLRAAIVQLKEARGQVPR